MTQPPTVTQALLALLVLVASAAFVSLALLSFVADRESQALVFAAGGGYLVVWAALRLSAPSRA